MNVIRFSRDCHHFYVNTKDGDKIVLEEHVCTSPMQLQQSDGTIITCDDVNEMRADYMNRHVLKHVKDNNGKFRLRKKFNMVIVEAAWDDTTPVEFMTFASISKASAAIRAIEDIIHDVQ